MNATASADETFRPDVHTAALADRGVLRVAGPDATSLLHGILTQDMALLGTQAAVYAGLLSPQGKILFDFLVVKAGADLLIDAPAEKIADLIKRFTLYRLRAKVTFTDVTADFGVWALWGGAPRPAPAGGYVFADPRATGLGWRAVLPRIDGPAWIARQGAAASAEAWHAHRIGLGVPEGGRDFAYGDAFPHEADMDQLAGVSFTKGCYVGQEVVSRMQHRGTARKRIVQAKAAGSLNPGAAVTAGDATIGVLGSVAGGLALALVRLDRAALARGKGVALAADGVPIELIKPAWATFEMEPEPVREAGL